MVPNQEAPENEGSNVRLASREDPIEIDHLQGRCDWPADEANTIGDVPICAQARAIEVMDSRNQCNQHID